MEINLSVKLDKLSDSEHKFINRWARAFRAGHQEKDTAAYRLYQMTDNSKNKYGYAEAVKKLTISSVPFNCYVSLKMYIPNFKEDKTLCALAEAIYNDVVKADSRRELAKAILDNLGAPDELYEKITNDKYHVSAFVSTQNVYEYKGEERYKSMSINKNYW